MNVCPKCGAAIPPEAPQGLCPKCLLAQASFPTETGPGTRHSRPHPPTRDELAKAFPQLEIIELIGQGGMGFVFKARQPKLDRFVALKILAQPLAEQTSFAERFTREGRTLAKLSHPNIVTIHDFGQAGPFFYLLMEYVDGVNLRQAMRAGAFTAEQAIAIVPKICEALQYAHNEGVLHRDIKPDNILLDARGRVKIADFGIAKLMAETAAENQLTGSGASLGTPHYMAPEQIERPNTVDHRADIFSLGVVFYEMLTGELPLGRFAAPSQKGNDPRLDEVVMQTLEKQPERRPQSAGEVRTKIEDIAATKPPPADVPGSKARKLPSWAKALLVAVSLILLIGPLTVFVYLLNVRRPDLPMDSVPPATEITADAREIAVSSITRYEGAIRLKSPTELFADEEIMPVIRYGQDAWTSNESVERRIGWHTSPTTGVDSTYFWFLPEPFTPGFDVMAAMERARLLVQRGAIHLLPNEVFTLFTATNGFQQTISGGFLYKRKENVQVPNSTRVTLRATSIGYAEQSEQRWVMGITFEGEIPPGTWLQTRVVKSSGNQPTLQQTMNFGKTFQMQWEDRLQPMNPLRTASEGKTYELALGERTEIFSVTNFGHSQRPRPIGDNAPPENSSITRGYLELKRLPQREPTP